MKKDRTKRKSREEEEMDRETDDNVREASKKKSKSKNAKLAELQDMWGDGDDDGGGDDRYDKLKEGKNIRRVLPNKDPDEPFFVTYAIHFNMGPDGEDKFRCIEPDGPFGHSKKKDKQRNYRAKACPACKMYCRNKSKARKFEFGSKEGKAYWRNHVAPWRAKLRFVWAQNPAKAKTREDRRKVFVFETGVMIGKPLVEAYYDEDMGGDFTDPKTGRLVIITKTKLGRNANEVEYDTRISPNRTPLKTWKRLKKQLPDLNTFLPEKLDPDAILAIMEGDGLPDDDDEPRSKKKKGKSAKGRFKSRDDDDEDLDDIEDDEDEEGDDRRRKLARRKRRDDEDVDPDADEEDDEDEPSKKSKMRDKLRKKARRDDDDDDSDDDEGDDDDDEDEDQDDQDEDDDDSEDDEDEDEDEDEDDADDEDDDEE